MMQPKIVPFLEVRIHHDTEMRSLY